MLFKIIVARTEMLDEWGWERIPTRQLHLKQLQLQALLTVIAGTDNCLSFSVKGNLGTRPVRILVAIWGCVCAHADAHMCVYFKSGRV